MKQLPPNWQIAPLAELIREPLRNGFSARALPDGTVRVLTLTAVTVGDFSQENTKLITPPSRGLDDLWLVPGDILIQRSNTRELVGTARQFRGEERWAIFPDLLIRARMADGIEPGWVELALSAEESRAYFRDAAQGIAGSMPKISQYTIEAFQLPIPPTSEQKRIVSEAELQLTRLRASQQALLKSRGRLVAYRAAVLRAACEGRLVPTEAELARAEGRVPDDGVELLLRIREATDPKQLKKSSAAREVGWGRDLPDPPEGWAWARIDEVGRVQLGRQRAPQHHNGPHMRPYLRVANVFEDRLDLSDVQEMNFEPLEYEKYQLASGDILLAEGQTPDLVGRSAVYNGEVPGACFQKTLLRFQAREGVSIRFAQIVFLAHLHSKRFKRASSITTNIAHLPQERFIEIEFPLPPLSEQHRIVAEVERHLSVIERLESAIEQNLARAKRLRQAILKRAFEGRLVPQDPKDEPASVLLERIRKEREAAATQQGTGKHKRRARR